MNGGRYYWNLILKVLLKEIFVSSCRHCMQSFLLLVVSWTLVYSYSLLAVNMAFAVVI